MCICQDLQGGPQPKKAVVRGPESTLFWGEITPVTKVFDVIYRGYNPTYQLEMDGNYSTYKEGSLPAIGRVITSLVGVTKTPWYRFIFGYSYK